MRYGIIICLFISFVFLFALPSFKKYMEAGVITEKSWTSLHPTDWPFLTLCKYHNETFIGWKNTHVTNYYVNYSWSWADQFCEEAKSIEDALACLHKETFNLSEKIIKGTIGGSNVSGILVNKDNSFWSEDLTQANYLGKDNIEQGAISSKLGRASVCDIKT